MNAARRLTLTGLVSICAAVGASLFASAPALAAAPEPPEVTVQSVTAGTASLQGVLNPKAEGEAGTYEFLYRESKTECKGGGAGRRGLYFGVEGEGVGEELSGLQTHTEYTVCLLARNLAGEATVGSAVHFTTALPPAAPETLAGEDVTAGAAKLAGVLNPGEVEAEAGSYEFLYRASAYNAGECRGERSSPATVTSGHREAVSAEVGELLPATRYTFCLVARNAAGEAAVGAPVTFTTARAAPTVGGGSTSAVGATSADVGAQIDPGGAPTGYRVEYVTEAQFQENGYAQATDVPVPDAELAAAPGYVAVSQELTGLQPSTVYHFRFAASNERGSAEGADATFTTPGAVGAAPLALPDGRVYEMVTPPENHDADAYAPLQEGNEESVIGSPWLPFEAAANGERVAYPAAPTTGGSHSEGRDQGNEYVATRSAGGGWTQADIQPPGFQSPIFETFSSDLSVGVLDSLEALDPGAVGGPIGEEGLGDFEISYDDLYTTSIPGGGEYDPLITTNPPYRTPDEFRSAGFATSGSARVEVQQLAFAGASADFSHLLFLANDALTAAGEGRPAAEGGSGGSFAYENNLYESFDGKLRLVNILPDGSTQAGATFGDGPRFEDVISADGSLVFWTDLHTGTDDGRIFVRENGTSTVAVSAGAAHFATATPDGRYVFYIEGGALYRFDVASETREPLTAANGLQSVAGVSEDGEYVYYVAGGETYLLRESGGVWGSPVLVAMTSGGAEVTTPDGHSIAFITGGTIFVYDADTGRLSCASCAANGANPGGASLPELSAAYTYQTRWLSADGSRVFFDSEAPLVPQDTNGKRDVYEWERDGSGSCTQSAGCVYLLSGGTDTAESFLLDASASGNDVFIITRAKLTLQDSNENYNVFDARVDGEMPLAPPACSGSGCQGVPAAPPVFATPASVTFSGVGNFPPPPPSAPVKAKTAAQLKAERLTKALKACKKDKAKKKRAACEKSARKKYGATKANKASNDRRAS